MKKIVFWMFTVLLVFTSCKTSSKLSATDDSSQFVTLTDAVPDAILEIRYFSTYNFVGTRIDGYGELGATLWRQFSIRKARFEVRADAKNLLDKQYEIVRSYPMPGRSWQVTLNMKY